MSAFVSALFHFGRSQEKPRGPRGRRAYVIGDVHGCLDQLERLLSCIEQELEERSRLKSHIVFLGDLIDRGPASAQVVERLRAYSPASASTHFVMGNHEEVMLRVLSGEAELFPSWLKFGGAETLRSYGLDPEELDELTPAERLERVKTAIPSEHVEFVKSFSDSISFGGYVFVHAGIRPGIELRDQSETDLRWIREPFLGDETDHGFTVVHGHTIANQVEVTRNRIGIDTGAFCTGRLTALAIQGSRRWLIQASAHAAERVPMD